MNLAEATRQLGGRSQRWHAVALDQARDRRVIDARLQGELALTHLLFLQLVGEARGDLLPALGDHIAGLCVDQVLVRLGAAQLVGRDPDPEVPGEDPDADDD